MIMSNPKFSVLMSVYANDKVEYLSLALSSLVNQSPAPDQIVIVMDGPVPSELELFLSEQSQAIDSLELHKIALNGGLAKALNYGLEFCRNETIARMDADDVCLDNRFAMMLPQFTSDVSLLGAAYDVYDQALRRKLGARFPPQEYRDVISYACWRTPFNHPTVLFRKSAVLRVGGYPEDVGRFEDWGLALRLIKHGYVIRNIATIVLKFRGGYEMLYRRSGLVYAKEEVCAIYALYRMGLISIRCSVLNVLLRLPIRLMPRGMIRMVYKILHKDR